MTSASLSAFNPTLIDGLRDQLADEFARRIFDAIPDISECIEFEAEGCDSAVGKLRFARASQLLYLRRRDLQSQTAAVVRRIFDERLSHLLAGASHATQLSLDKMTLLADERLDEEIAINHCSRRLKEQCEYELWGLTQRLLLLTGTTQSSDSHSPVYPQTFAEALMEAIDSLETDAGVRLVVFKTFGPVLLEIVPAVYTAANSALTARGIEVESGEYYGRPVLTQEHPSTALPTSQEVAMGAVAANQLLASTLRQLLARTLSSQPVHVELPDGHPGQRPLAATLQTPIVRTSEAAEPAWRAGLHDIESGCAAAAADPAAGARALHATRRALQEKFTRDEQVISDIVTVMFDRLRTEPRLPARLRAAVARLQLPVLELALRDRSLLTQVHHPVRKLLDLIAEFGLTLGLDNDDDSTVRSVDNIIDGLVQIHNVEPHAFSLAFARLDDFFYHHEEAALQNDATLRELERHEAAEFAGSQADREIALRLQNLSLPAAISDFIVTAWRDVLVHNYQQRGAMGQPWKLGLVVLDDIIKSLRPSTDDTERRRLARILPPMIEMLLNTPDTTDDQDLLAANFFAELQRAHELALAGRWQDIGGAPVVSRSAALETASSVDSPSAALASLGLACGDWIETRDFAGTRRWRLNWITTIRGTCVFRHYETNSTRNMSCEELRERLSSGEVQRVRGLGLADDVLNSAFEIVSRKARRDEAMLAVRVPGAASRGASMREVTRHWGPSTASLPPVQYRVGDN